MSVSLRRKPVEGRAFLLVVRQAHHERGADCSHAPHQNWRRSPWTSCIVWLT